MHYVEQPEIEEPEASANEDSSLARRLAEKLLAALGNPAICLVLWTGEQVAGAVDPPLVTLRIADRGTLLRLLLDPELQFGEAFMAGRIECVAGDLARGLEAVFRNAPSWGGMARQLINLGGMRSWLRRNSLSGSRRNIHAHYDVGNDFYRLWLDPTMSYTCAYFANESLSLHAAQLAKMDHVCRKLRLRPGEQVIEAGCGWGSLALHMAERYGVKVKAFNISTEQIEYARERAARTGWSDRVEYIHDDYRHISGTADAFVSVGMLEHVGVEHYAGLGELVSRLLRSGGRGLIHSIGRDAPRAMNPWIERHIFPGARIPSLSQMMQVFEPNRLSVLDVENLRLHYARTLACWRNAFELAKGTVASMFDERFIRMWRLYLVSSQAAFLAGDMQLFQVLFVPSRSTQMALTREHLYREPR